MFIYCFRYQTYTARKYMEIVSRGLNSCFSCFIENEYLSVPHKASIANSIRIFSAVLVTSQTGSPGRHLILMLRSNRRQIRSVRPDSSCVAVPPSQAGPKQFPTVRLIERSTSPTYSGLHRCSPWVRSDSACTCCVGSTHHELCSIGCLHTESSSATDLESLRTPRLP